MYVSLICISIFANLVSLQTMPGGTTTRSDDLVGSECVLLENGQVVTGKVERQADKITVVKPSGSRIRFSVSQVVSIQPSLADMYWLRCSLISPTDSSGHKKLFRWCLHHDLFREAQNQIDILLELDLSAAELDMLHSALSASIQKESAQLESKQPVKLEASATASSEIGLVGYEVAEATLKRQELMARLASAMNSIPRESVAQFKMKIEPLLMNSCYTAKCHSSESDSFALMAVAKSTPIPKRMSQRNLANVLKWTDNDDPLNSLILKKAALPHGGQAQPIIKVQSPQFHLLKKWLIGISARPTVNPRIPDYFFATDLDVDHLVTESQTDSEPEKAPREENMEPIPKKVQDRTNASPVQTTIQHEKSVDDVQHADPFDPAVFNRKYGNTEDTEPPAEEPDKQPAPKP